MSAPAQEYHALVCLGGLDPEQVQRHLRALHELDAVSVAGAWPLTRGDGTTAYVVHVVCEAPGADDEHVRGRLRIAAAAVAVQPDVRDVVGFAVA